METPPSAPAANRRPWPMTWIVAAIAVYILVYTAINVVFRKPAPPHEPFAEAQQREQQQREHRVVRNSTMGWTQLAARFESTAQPDASPRPGGAATLLAAATPPPTRLDKALPIDLVLVVPGKPNLHPGPRSVRAPVEVGSSGPLRLALQFTDADPVPRLGETLAYAKERLLFVLLQDESRLAAGAEPMNSRESLDLVIGATDLAPGEWQATLHTADHTFIWTFTVR